MVRFNQWTFIYDYTAYMLRDQICLVFCCLINISYMVHVSEKDFFQAFLKLRKMRWKTSQVNQVKKILIQGVERKGLEHGLKIAVPNRIPTAEIIASVEWILQLDDLDKRLVRAEISNS